MNRATALATGALLAAAIAVSGCVTPPSPPSGAVFDPDGLLAPDDPRVTALLAGLRNTAVDLSFEKQWIHDGANIVDNDVSNDPDRANFRIDLDLTHMATIWECCANGHKRCPLMQPRFHSGW